MSDDENTNDETGQDENAQSAPEAPESEVWEPRKGSKCTVRLLTAGGSVMALNGKVTKVNRDGTFAAQADVPGRPSSAQPGRWDALPLFDETLSGRPDRGCPSISPPT